MILLSTLSEADLGRLVVYTPHTGPTERGIITSWNEEFIFVRYGTNPQGNPTSPHDLVWAPISIDGISFTIDNETVTWDRPEPVPAKYRYLALAMASRRFKTGCNVEVDRELLQKALRLYREATQ